VISSLISLKQALFLILECETMQFLLMKGERSEEKERWLGKDDKTAIKTVIIFQTVRKTAK
jgi:hypothetical protein